MILASSRSYAPAITKTRSNFKQSVSLDHNKKQATMTTTTTRTEIARNQKLENPNRKKTMSN